MQPLLPVVEGFHSCLIILPRMNVEARRCWSSVPRPLFALSALFWTGALALWWAGAAQGLSVVLLGPVHQWHQAAQSPAAAAVVIRQIQYFSVSKILNVPSKRTNLPFQWKCPTGPCITLVWTQKDHQRVNVSSGLGSEVRKTNHRNHSFGTCFSYSKNQNKTGIELCGCILYLYILMIFSKMLLKNTLVGALILGFLVLPWMQRHIKLTKMRHIYSIYNSQSTHLNGEEERTGVKWRINYRVLINYQIKTQSSISLTWTFFNRHLSFYYVVLKASF